MFTLINSWLLILFLPVAFITLIESSFEPGELNRMGIRIQ